MAIKYKPYMYMRQEIPPKTLVVIHIAIKKSEKSFIIIKDYSRQKCFYMHGYSIRDNSIKNTNDKISIVWRKTATEIDETFQVCSKSNSELHTISWRLTYFRLLKTNKRAQ